MQYRDFGRTGLRVSEISLGAWSLGGIVRVKDRTSSNADPCGYGEMGEQEGIAIVDRALSLGINLIDTAPMYGDGNSEIRVCKSLEAHISSEATVCTKCGVFAQDGRYVRDFSRDAIMREVEKSRKRLQCDVLDIELLHSPTVAELGAGECWDTLLELKRQGVVRFVGISVHSEPEQARQFIESGLCDVMMLRLNLLDTAMRSVLPLAARHGVAVMVRESLCGGFLTGLFDESTQFGPDDQRAYWPREQVLDFVHRVDDLRFLGCPGRTLAQAAIQWVLAQPGVSTVTVGAARPHELDENTQVSDMGAPAPAELDAVEEVLERHQATRSVSAPKNKWG